MIVKVSGRALTCDGFTSNKTGEYVRQLKLFDGRDLVRVSNVPALFDNVEFGKQLEVSCRLIQSVKGTFLVYEESK